MLRSKPFRPKPRKERRWKREAPSAGLKRDLYLADRAKDRERDKRERAEIWGCEYGDWLRAWFEDHGCCLCKRFPRLCELHHVKTRGARGKARHQVPICWKCHRKGDSPGNSFEALAAEAGVDLLQVAADLAAQGDALGLLTFEQCSLCTEWHSERYMIDSLDTASGVTLRLCLKCAPEGPR